VDGVALAFDDGDMKPTTSQHTDAAAGIPQMRASTGRAHNGKKFKEACETVVVNGARQVMMLGFKDDSDR
jgi:hypothetical protein